MTKVETDLPMESFVLIKASELKLSDKFMKHDPTTKREKELKKLLTRAIRKKVNDFWKPIYDPSLDEKGNICFVPDAKPALMEDYNWWEEVAKNFCPDRESRLGSKLEYVAFVGVLIKMLVQYGVTVADAWNVICNDSTEIANYHTEAKHGVEHTGSVGIYGFKDLGNTYKILAEEEDGYLLASGGAFSEPDVVSIARMVYQKVKEYPIYDGTGWIVLS